MHSTIQTGFLRNAFVLGGAVGGLMLPDFILGRVRKRYQAAIDRGLPDALDMMVMCAESGLSLEPTIARVGQEHQTAGALPTRIGVGKVHPNVSGGYRPENGVCNGV